MMKSVAIIVLSLALASLINPGNAHAYLDPGTGSVILQALAAVLLAVGGVWYGFKARAKSIFNKKKTDAEEDGKQ